MCLGAHRREYPLVRALQARRWIARSLVRPEAETDVIVAVEGDPCDPAVHRYTRHQLAPRAPGVR